MNYTLQIKPLSINCAFKGKKYRTSEYDAFIKNMLMILPKTMHFPDEKNIKIAFEFGLSNRSADLDNFLKTTIDCMVKKYRVDDRYIYELHVFKAIVPKGKEYIKFKIY